MSTEITPTSAATAANSLDADAKRVAQALSSRTCICSTRAEFSGVTDTGFFSATLLDGSVVKIHFSSLCNYDTTRSTCGVATLTLALSAPRALAGESSWRRDERVDLFACVVRALEMCGRQAASVGFIGWGEVGDAATYLAGKAPQFREVVQCTDICDERVSACLKEMDGFGYRCLCKSLAGESGIDIACELSVDDLGMNAEKFQACGFQPGLKIVLNCHFLEGYLAFGEWEEAKQVSLTLQLVDSQNDNVKSALQWGLNDVLQNGFWEMAKCRTDMNVSWEDVFCLKYERERDGIEDSVAEMHGEYAQRAAEKGNLILMAVRWIRREIYCCFSRCIRCRMPLSNRLVGAVASFARFCEHATCRKAANENCGSICAPQLATGELEAVILADPVAADLCVSLCFATLFRDPNSEREKMVTIAENMRQKKEDQDHGPKVRELSWSELSQSDQALSQIASSERLPLVVALDPTPPIASTPEHPNPLATILKYQDDREWHWRSPATRLWDDQLFRSGGRALTEESYLLLRKVLLTIPKMDSIYAVCRGSGKLREYLNSRHSLAYAVMEWILVFTRPLNVSFISKDDQKIRQFAFQAEADELDGNSIKLSTEQPALVFPGRIPLAGVKSKPLRARALASKQLRSAEHPKLETFQFSVDSNETVRGQTSRNMASQGSVFGYHGSALGRWWSILHNSLDCRETENPTNGTDEGNGVYIAGAYSLASSFGKACLPMAIWPGSLLEVESIVGVVEVSEPPRLPVIPDQPLSKEMHRFGQLCVQNEVPLRYLLCTAKAGNAGMMDRYYSALASLDPSYLQLSGFGRESMMISVPEYKADESFGSQNTANLRSIADSNVIYPARSITSFWSRYQESYPQCSCAGFTNANTFRDVDGYHIPLRTSSSRAPVVPIVPGNKNQ